MVYTNTVVTGVGALAARLARKLHVWHSHESGFHNSKLKFDLGNRCAAFLIDRLSACIVVVSRSVQNDYSTYIKPDRIRLIFQAVTLRDETAEENSNFDHHVFTCAIVGSLHPWKGQDEAITAISEVVRWGYNACLLIIGDGNRRFREKLNQQVTEYGLEQWVKFLGYVENPIPYISIADVVLVCSRWEAFGRITVEAMLTGRAVIASARGGTTELIKDMENGLLYDYGNYVQLATEIKYLCENPNERYLDSVQPPGFGRRIVLIGTDMLRKYLICWRKY